MTFTVDWLDASGSQFVGSKAAYDKTRDLNEFRFALGFFRRYHFFSFVVAAGSANVVRLHGRSAVSAVHRGGGNEEIVRTAHVTL
jgi:hypothetical protein